MSAKRGRPATSADRKRVYFDRDLQDEVAALAKASRPPTTFSAMLEYLVELGLVAYKAQRAQQGRG